MREIPGSAILALACVLLDASASSASAEDVYKLVQNQNGFDLPGVALPQGQDEVRASDGTTCSSSVSGSGAYLDVGVIKNNRTFDSSDMATYGRVVIPLGRSSKRLDCTKLYKLEVERLQMELDLMKMGIASPDETITTSAVEPAEPAVPPSKPKKRRTQKKGWVDDGWTLKGIRD